MAGKGGGGGGKTTKLDAGAGGPVDASQYAAYGSYATSASYMPSPFWDNLTPDDKGGFLGYSGEMIGANEWDRVKVNSNYLPGIWSATATPALQLDVQKPNGYDGAALIEKGYVPAGITLTGKLWLPMHWAEFQRQLPTFWRAPNKWAINDVKKSTAQIVPIQLSLTIYAPAIAPFGLSNMVIYQITPPEETDQPQVRQIKMLARQYVPQPQKRTSAARKVDGAGKDRSVQHDIITANANAMAMGGFAGQLRRPEVANNMPAPSVLQARLKLPSLPNYAKR
jgi:hypothetical protein